VLKKKTKATLEEEYQEELEKMKEVTTPSHRRTTRE